MGERARFAAFISGRGRTLRNLDRAIEEGRLPGEIGVVVASRECPGAAWARERGLEVLVQKGRWSAEACERLLDDAGAEWGVLGGYTRLLPIPERFVNRFVNIHPALLPSFGGAGMYGDRVHEAVLAAGCKVSGCTVHLCDGTYDTGPIVAQRCCAVMDGDTVRALADRVFALECEVYPDALRALFCGDWSIEGRRVRMIG